MDSPRAETPAEPVEIPTPYGPARAHLRLRPRGRGALVLGHGAGGGIGAADLQASVRAAQQLGFSVVLVEQPYRVAGRRAPAPAGQLDTAWSAVVSHLADHELAGQGLVVGGRSLGARVACRTASSLHAVGVLCLAFPLLPPVQARSPRPPTSRLPELEALALPTLIVQGERDRFGIPPPGPRREVVLVPGDHALRSDLNAVETAVGDWLQTL